MTKKIEVGSLTHERPKTQAEKLIATTEKPEQTRADINKKKIDSVNRKADEPKTSIESRSQHKAKGSLKSKHRTIKPEQTRADINKKKIDSVNRKADEPKTSIESRSQHKAKGSLKSKHRTMLIKPKTDDYLKAIATIYGTSVNEVINQALDAYVAIKLQDPEIGSKIKLLQEIQIKD